jgi:hypothetical protein
MATSNIISADCQLCTHDSPPSVFGFFDVEADTMVGTACPRTPALSPPSGSMPLFRFSPACSSPPFCGRLSPSPPLFLRAPRSLPPPRPPRPPRARPPPRPPRALSVPPSARLAAELARSIPNACSSSSAGEDERVSRSYGDEAEDQHTLWQLPCYRFPV